MTAFISVTPLRLAPARLGQTCDPTNTPHKERLTVARVSKPAAPKTRATSVPTEALFAETEQATSVRKSTTELAKELPSVAHEDKPGIRDSKHFLEGDSVRFWRYYKRVDDLASFRARLAANVEAMSAEVRQKPSSVVYWTYHLGRSTFFALLAVSSLVAGLVSRRMQPSFVNRMASQSMYIWDEAWHTFEQELRRIRKGEMKMPWDMRLGHRQYNVALVARDCSRFLVEGVNIGGKLQEGKPRTDVWLAGKTYPEYYSQTYHYQTDGWLSSHSANVYEVSTETMFIGRQDSMQRLTLYALNEYLKPRELTPRKAPVVVEVAAGTGRFSTFVRDNWPGIDMIISDLSPFYLEKARENMKYWERSTQATGKELGTVRFLHSRAEDLPLEDSSVDVLYSTYLFHELPPSARKAVVAEAARVLKPGGLYIMTDSIQLGDRLDLDQIIASFGELNEPWYESYLVEDFGELVTDESKFLPARKEVSSVSKMLSFIRT